MLVQEQAGPTSKYVFVLSASTSQKEYQCTVHAWACINIQPTGEVLSSLLCLAEHGGASLYS